MRSVEYGQGRSAGSDQASQPGVCFPELRSAGPDPLRHDHRAEHEFRAGDDHRALRPERHDGQRNCRQLWTGYDSSPTTATAQITILNSALPGFRTCPSLRLDVRAARHNQHTSWGNGRSEKTGPNRGGKAIMLLGINDLAQKTNRKQSQSKAAKSYRFVKDQETKPMQPPPSS